MSKALDINIERRFGEFELAVNTRFSGDGITAVFGPSGCGKSTLLRIIAGLEGKAKGEVKSGSTIWQDAKSFMPPWQRGIGFVFQEPRLFPHLSVAGNLAYAQKRAVHIQSPITYDKVVAALDLSPLLTRRVTALSGGEKQIGRAHV